jgi:hypothetical protein
MYYEYELKLDIRYGYILSNAGARPRFFFCYNRNAVADIYYLWPTVSIIYSCQFNILDIIHSFEFATRVISRLCTLLHSDSLSAHAILNSTVAHFCRALFLFPYPNCGSHISKRDQAISRDAARFHPNWHYPSKIYRSKTPR